MLDEPTLGVLQTVRCRRRKKSVINSACAEKVQVDSIDDILAICLEWLRESLSQSDSQRLVGRTWDLKSAYKQLAVQAEHKKFACVAMCDPASGKVRVAHLHSMLFGAVAAVHAFLRCSEALKALGREKFALVMTSFFDDFTVITQKCHARHVSAVVSNFFSKLGWQVAAEPKTNVDFSEVFDVAGVRVALPGREWYLYRTSQAGPLSSASCSVMPWTVDPSRQTRLIASEAASSLLNSKSGAGTLVWQ